MTTNDFLFSEGYDLIGCVTNWVVDVRAIPSIAGLVSNSFCHISIAAMFSSVV